MTEETEKRLAALGTDDARAELVEGTLEEATAFVRSACRNMLPPDEQMSIAGTVLMTYVATYDASRGRLLTYIKPALLGAVRQAWRDREPVEYGAQIPDWPDDDLPPDERTAAGTEGAVDPEWDMIDVHERFEALRPYLNRLEEHELRVLILHHNGGMSFAFIAEETSVTRAAVQRTYRVALRKLRNYLMDAKVFNKLRSQPA